MIDNPFARGGNIVHDIFTSRRLLAGVAVASLALAGCEFGDKVGEGAREVDKGVQGCIGYTIAPKGDNQFTITASLESTEDRVPLEGVTIHGNVHFKASGHGRERVQEGRAIDQAVGSVLALDFPPKQSLKNIDSIEVGLSGTNIPGKKRCEKNLTE